METDKTKRMFTLRLPEDLAQRLEKTAEKNVRSLRAEVEIAIRAHLDRENAKSK